MLGFAERRWQPRDHPRAGDESAVLEPGFVETAKRPSGVEKRTLVAAARVDPDRRSEALSKPDLDFLFQRKVGSNMRGRRRALHRQPVSPRWNRVERETAQRVAARIP